MGPLLLTIGLGLTVVLCGCVGHYNYALDTGPIQAGCFYRFDPPNASEKATPSVNTEPRNINFRLGFPWWVSTDRDSGVTVNGLALAPLLNVGNDTVNGIAIAPMFWSRQNNGLVLAPWFTLSNEVNGVSVSCLNWVAERSWGQVGICNRAGVLDTSGEAIVQVGLLNGTARSVFQAGLLNHSRVDSRLQLGAVNTVSPDKFTHGEGAWPSTQIGLVNSAPAGLQLGLLNRNERAWRWKWCPLINFSSSE